MVVPALSGEGSAPSWPEWTPPGLFLSCRVRWAGVGAPSGRGATEHPSTAAVHRGASCVLPPIVHAQSCPTPRPRGLTAAHQAPLSMGFPRQEYWSGLPCSPLGDPPDPGIELASPASTGGFFTAEPPGKPSRPPCSQSMLLSRCPQPHLHRGNAGNQPWPAPWLCSQSSQCRPPGAQT